MKCDAEQKKPLMWKRSELCLLYASCTSAASPEEGQARGGERHARRHASEPAMPKRSRSHAFAAHSGHLKFPSYTPLLQSQKDKNIYPVNRRSHILAEMCRSTTRRGRLLWPTLCKSNWLQASLQLAFLHWVISVMKVFILLYWRWNWPLSS